MPSLKAVSRKNSKKVKPRNQPTKLTLEERMARLESKQESFWSTAESILGKLESLAEKLKLVHCDLYGKVKAKRLSAKAGVRNG